MVSTYQDRIRDTQVPMLVLDTSVGASVRPESFTDFPLDQAWRVDGFFGVWGISVAEDSIWITGQMSLAGSNARPVNGLARFPATNPVEGLAQYETTSKNISPYGT